MSFYVFTHRSRVRCSAVDRILLMMGLRLAGFLAILAACVALAEDSEKAPNRIVVIGDLHGDMGQCLSVLRASEVISMQPDYYRDRIGDGKSTFSWLANPFGGTAPGTDIEREHVNRNMVYNKRGHLMAGTRADVYHWAGDDTMLVIVGDAMNVGPDDMDILYFLKRLAHEATHDGGRIEFLLGNHELQNLQGNYMGVHPWSFERSGGRTGRTLALSMRTPLGAYLRSRPVVFEYDGMIFAHGGFITSTVNELKERLPNFEAKTWVHSLNKRVRAALETMTQAHDGTPTSKVSDKAAAFILDYQYAESGDDKSPILVHPLEKCDEVKEANKLLGVDVQVVGHTPHDPPEYRFCGGRLLAVDFHMSQWKAGQGAAYAAIQLLRSPRRHNHTNGPGIGEMSWHTSLIVPAGDVLEADMSKQYEASQSRYGWKSFIVAVVLTVVAVEIIRCYCWRRNKRPSSGSNLNDSD